MTRVRIVTLALAVLIVVPVVTFAPATVRASGGTSVAGQLTGDLHWTVAGSPYTFTDNVTVATGAILTIDPGVTVNGNGLAFNIAGVVTSAGTAADPILINRVRGPRMFAGSDGSSFAWTEFRDNTDYLRPSDTHGPLPALGHVWFNGGQGFYLWYPLSGGTVPTPFVLSDARFTNGARLDGCCTAWSASRVSIEGGRVMTAKTYNLAISITDSNILRASSGVCAGNSDTRCAFDAYAGDRPISATNVWWGTTDVATINTMIWDGLDDPTIPVVALDPVRTAPIDLTGPTATIGTTYAESIDGTVSGTAADAPLGDSGVADVDVSLRNTATGEWWDGDVWGATEVFLPATGTTAWSFSLPTLADGTYAVRAQATDGAGNPSWGVASGTVIVDSIAPTGTVTIASGAAITSDALVSVSIPATDASPVTHYRVSLDGSTWATYSYSSSTVNVPLTDPDIGGSSAQGKRTVWVAWRDAAGHWSAPASDDIVYDEAPPAGTVSIANGAAAINTTDVPIAVPALDDSGVAKVRLSNDGLAWTTFDYAPSVPWTLVDVDGTRTVWAAWQDAGGSWSDPSFDTIMLDRAAPSIPSLSATPRAGASLSGSGVPLALGWSVSTDASSGVTGYGLEGSTNGGAWTPIGTYAGRSAGVMAASSGTVRYRVRAVDAADNEGGWAYTATLSPRLTQQSSTAVKYGGIWYKGSSTKYSGGSVRYARVAGRSASYKFTGSSIALVTTKAASRGKVKIYVNGVYQGRVDLYRSSAQYGAIAWQKTWASAGARTIKLVVVGTSGRPRVDVDAFVVLR